MSRRLRRYRGGVTDPMPVPTPAPTPVPTPDMAVSAEPEKPGMFSSFKMPSLGSSDPQKPGEEKKGLFGMFGLGGGKGKGKGRRSSKRGSKRKSTRRRRH